MDTLVAINMLVTLTGALTNLAANTAQISALIQKAQSEGRTSFTPDEWKIITGADDAARAALADAVASALKRPA